jgi:hypothetical protein
MYPSPPLQIYLASSAGLVRQVSRVNKRVIQHIIRSPPLNSRRLVNQNSCYIVLVSSLVVMSTRAIKSVVVIGVRALLNIETPDFIISAVASQVY